MISTNIEFTNSAKQRYHALLPNIKLVTSDLKSSLSDEHFKEVQKNIELSREKVYKTVRNRLIEKYELLAGQRRNLATRNPVQGRANTSTTVASAPITTTHQNIVKKAVLNFFSSYP